MPVFVDYQIKRRVAILTISNPPVNALGEGVREAIRDAVRRASADPDADAIVLIGAGTTFVAGADIKAFDAIKTHEASLARSEWVHSILTGIEDSPKPVVAAIHGHALGGGLELAMACHYRVAVSAARLGQPEVHLGLIPGAGGSQRLPRLVGGELALRMCTDGAPISASDAAAAGLVDQVVAGDLLEAAIDFAQEQFRTGGRRKTREIAFTAADTQAGLAAVGALGSKLTGRRGSLAPMKAVDAIAAAYTLPFDQGAARERELFADCLLSNESRALRHLFFAERDAARPSGLPRDTPVLAIARAAVIGAGTMGAGIAMCYASAGIPVLLHDVDSNALARGLATIRRHYEGSVAKGRISQAQLDTAIGLIVPTTTYNDLGHVDLVVEAAFENLELKKQIFAALGEATRPDCILASNTSTLDIDELARASGRPSQVVGHHFFSPAQVMKLLEIVRGRDTSDTVIASSLAIGKRIGKICAVVGNCFGFVANRMLAYYMREAYLLLEEGATVEQIDRVVVEFGLPVGPFAMQDIAGIDVGTRIRQHLAAMGKTRADGPQSEVPDRLFDLGRYGQKTSAGWYRYEPGARTPIPDPLIDEIAAAAAGRRGIERRAHISDDEILARITTALANEGALVLGEGYAARASDIDVIYCYGFGFPRYRGGPLFYAETIGLAAVLRQVQIYRATLGDYWTPAPLLEQLVADGRSLYDVAAATV
jgi:3-hydroxyacyl-CoA dehydrogenase